MGKKRIFYIDFIRVVSMFIIVTYHFYAHFYENNISGFRILSSSKWGIIGVAMFFMISGASLIYNYGDNIKIKKYFKNRFLGIYPMFWIAYILVFLYLFYESKAMVHGDLPLIRIVFTVLGMDGYLSPYIHTFYLLGEWFLGAIIIIYTLFPLLRILFNKFSKIFFVISTIVNILVLLFCKNFKMPINMNIIVSLYSFILGMYVFKYIKKVKLWQMIILLLIFIGLYLIPEQTTNITVLISNCLGYLLYIILMYIGANIKSVKIKELFVIIGKYSYAIFLLHHIIIMKVENTFQFRQLRVSETFLLYMTVWVIILISSKILYSINKKLVDFIKQYAFSVEIQELKNTKTKN